MHLKSCKKLFLENLPKFLILFELKSVFETSFGFEFVLHLNLGNRTIFGNWKNLFLFNLARRPTLLSLYSAYWPKAIARLPPTLSHPHGPSWPQPTLSSLPGLLFFSSRSTDVRASPTSAPSILAE